MEAGEWTRYLGRSLMGRSRNAPWPLRWMEAPIRSSGPARGQLALGCRPAFLSRRGAKSCRGGGDGEVTPANRPRDAGGNDRLISDMHRRELRIARAKQRLRRIVFGPVSQNLSSAVQHDPSEPRPVLVIAVEEQCNGWVLGHVA